MTEVSSVSQSQLKERRSSLRRQRRLKIVQRLWQVWAMAALTGGIFWAASHPVWLIHSENQVEVEGNQVLSDQAIRSLISLDYPQPLLKVQPEAIVQQLQQRAPVTSATVVRQLFPPRINVYIQERRPVAKALPTTTKPQQPQTQNAALESTYVQPGFLDQNGVWMPQSSFMMLEEAAELPELEVYGMRPRYSHYWPQLYRTLRQSPVKVRRIDWGDPNDLVLHTDLGVVRLGPYNYRFPEQLAVLDRLRSLPGQVDASNVAYIDLRNPDAPSIQFLQVSQEGGSGN